MVDESDFHFHSAKHHLAKYIEQVFGKENKIDYIQIIDVLDRELDDTARDLASAVVRETDY